jgi:two-component system LytT family response regulator
MTEITHVKEGAYFVDEQRFGPYTMWHHQHHFTEVKGGVKMEDIVRLRGNGNFTDIYLSNGSKKMVCRFLKHFSEILPFPFMRVHKSHIINSTFVKNYNKGGYVTLFDNSEIEISTTYKDDFLKKFR